ncbi:HigA family addiction module antitoxin [Aurantimonas sp. C2-6-R+9]|uniref:HigA family addiction module antitoxin n=1 Tax=unclassified Aurantimonas TaxID=2638230 RepID=UPI002E19030C|nr:MULTISPECIES: HigA family addiction module antitoxin [unclassified Aurantimonas]MEC5292780.1 HigA family addiction module antitoxin [Aurantimonas sp. C2-3-R2]MEC5382995.1 HigA family addiction module antitoxin [Aurantimonas sp. C2-6-R+9]MEC5413832.1 HigA family addiction module antitoxin [Aurantimonas sp. C2-4-R8]
MSFASCLVDVPHPGEFIREELDARGWSQRDLAYILGAPEQAVNLITSGKRGISPEMAKALGKAFDVSAGYFANLQKAYEMANAREPDPGIAKRSLLQGSYPIREMIKRRWLEDTDVGLLEAQMMRFFCKNDLSDVPYLAHAAKKADYSNTTPEQIAWLFRVRQIAAEIITPAYSEQKLKAFVEDMPRLMADPEETRHVPRALAECGVRYVVVETLPKANIDGVCFWLDSKSPTIGMTLRHDRIDNFWFVLRHEIEHVLNKDGQGNLEFQAVDHDLEGKNGGVGEDLPPEERRANLAAAEICVPQDQLESFYVRKFPYISERDTIGFAKRVQRHPGIVVGQLQRKMERYDWLIRHKVKIRQHILGSAVVDGWGVPANVSL